MLDWPDDVPLPDSFTRQRNSKEKKTVNRTETLKRQIQLMSERLAELENMPDPAEYPDGTVALWRVQYPSGAIEPYTYVGMKVGDGTKGRWYTTSRSVHSNLLTNAQLQDIWAGQKNQMVLEVSIVSAWDVILGAPEDAKWEDV